MTTPGQAARLVVTDIASSSGNGKEWPKAERQLPYIAQHWYRRLMPQVSTQRTFVLVHGAFHGGWCWAGVAQRLRGRGHIVYAPSLTGLADRSHLASASVTLETHILDVLNLLRWESLHDVVLCGHSYGGMVIAGAADRAPPGQIASIIFFDALLPHNRMALTDYPPPENDERTGFSPNFADGLVYPPDASAFGVPQDLQAFVNARVTPQPVGTLSEPLVMTRGYEHVASKSFVLCARSSGLSELQRGADHARQQEDWRFRAIEAGHDAMLEQPELVAELLSELA